MFMRKANLHWLLAGLISFLFVMTLRSQNGHFRFDNFNTEHGLTQNSVLCILQDKQGYMWFGTYSGLNRFDGYTFQRFENVPEDTSTLSNNFIRSLCLDSVGNVWVGTANGLNRFNSEKECFERFYHDENDSLSIPHDFIYNLYCDHQGIPWVVTRGGGVCRIVSDQEQTVEAKQSYRFVKEVFRIQNHNELDVVLGSSIIKTTDGELWVSTDLGLLRRKHDQEIWQHYVHDNVNPYSLSSNDVSALLQDDRKNVWVGTWGRGLQIYDPSKDGYLIVPLNRFVPAHNDGVDFVMTLYKDSQGGVWVGCWGGGLFRIQLPNEDDGSVELLIENLDVKYFQNELTLMNSISGNNIYAVHEDHTGIIWVGTDWHGVNKYDPYSDYIYHVYNNPLNVNSLSENIVFALCADDDQSYWIGTLNGLNRWDKKNGQFERYYYDSKHANSLSSNNVRSLLKDRSGRLWVGTVEGLDLFNPSTRTFKRYPFHMPSFQVETILEDITGEGFWVGTYGYGMYHFDPVTGEYQRPIFNKNADIRNLFTTNIWDIVQDQNGVLWIATDDMGLCQYNPKTYDFKSHQNIKGDSSSISSNKVMTLMIDSNQNYWVGTINGLNKMILDKDHPDQIRFRTYTTGSGINSNQISSLHEDAQGYIWISTNVGICRLNPVDGSIKIIGLKYNIRSREYLSDAVCFDPSTAEILFGSVNGVTVVKTEHIYRKTLPPKMVINQLSIFNKDVNVGEVVNGRVILENSLSQTPKLVLTHREGVFGFGFAALHYSSPDFNSYAYKLEGFDVDWNEVGNQRNATYTNLSPGTYRFLVKGANSDGVWCERPAELTLVILPPWWKMLWFRLLLVIVVCLLILLIFNYRLRSLHRQKLVLSQMVALRTEELSEMNIQMEERQEEITSQNEELQLHRQHLEKMVDERTLELRKAKDKAEESDRLKTSFLANMSHEIRTPMNAIIGFSSLLEDEVIESDERKKYVDMIKTNGDALLAIINDILDISMLESNQLVLNLSSFCLDDLMKDIYAYFDYSNINHLEFKLLMPHRQQPLMLYSDSMRVRQVMNNLLTNSFKFTFHGFVRMGYQISDDRVVLFVSDSGLGINDNDKKSIFNHFRKIDSDTSKYHPGTGIGLSISKRLVDLLGGKIWFESEVNTGSTFYVSFPLNTDVQ
jgi:signal transduction histidine kinase/ligand-binding sensor domain-containing protein